MTLRFRVNYSSEGRRVFRDSMKEHSDTSMPPLEILLEWPRTQVQRHVCGQPHHTHGTSSVISEQEANGQAKCHITVAYVKVHCFCASVCMVARYVHVAH